MTAAPIPMKPPFAYFGGKSRLADRIVALLPPHRVYLEPYLGSGAVLFAKGPAPVEIVNDLDDAIVTFFRVLRDRPDELETACALSPYSRTEYAGSDPFADGIDDLEIARRFWVRVSQGFAKSTAAGSGWSTTATKSVADTVHNRLGRFAPAARRLAGVQIENCDAAELVCRSGKTADTLIYVDPPYLADTRTWRATPEGGHGYRLDHNTERDHRRLADALHQTDATVILSGYDNPLYDELYDDWWRTRFDVHENTSNAARASRGRRTETLWSNRDLTRQPQLDLGEPAWPQPTTGCSRS
ncbi:Methyltransferase (plasmid) [Euzebya pacifica]|uniref:Methyltransferase n=1 Tax=Euzebya pacifica TaxID=1608957 RepID=A0A346Y5V6_9ACTN|nr:DNA adenine methylase [Euzebya pacifica]AXV09853.1 Methyltransferase [Euzebya pacifica]